MAVVPGISAGDGRPMHAGPTVLLDDATPDAERMLSFGDVRRVICAHHIEEVPGALAMLESARALGRHLAGYFSYELGYALEPRLRKLGAPPTGLPLLWFAEFDWVKRFEGREVVRELGSRIQGRAYAGPLAHQWSDKQHRERFRIVQELIRAGDIYQANLTFRSRFAFVGDAIGLYLALRERSLAPYCAYIDDGARQILSLSPELFFEVSSNGRITARPMKGTAARAHEPRLDDHAREALASSEKDRAENLMIVDLIRNDLGRVAELGSVEVGDLFAVERYPTLHQLVSTITAQLRNDVDIAGLIGALFPCGSVTGAPKIRAMEVIRQLEASARGIYCGAIGYFAPDGSARFNVAIRTITIEGDSGELGIGGGVVHDSTDAAEYAECLLKAEYFTRTRRPLGLIETLRFAPGVGLVRRDLHLARLARSARSFGIPFDVSTTERLIQDVVSTHVCDARVRLELAEDGSSKVKAEAMNAPAGRIWRYSLSPRRVLSSDALAGHKTDWRIRYDDERTRLQAALGCDEVVFLNERGEVVEGSITNVFLERGDKLLTPPLASGCLDGCLRRELLEQGAAVEAVLYEWDLPTARLYLGNSLRGLILGEFVDASGIETPKTRAQQGRR